MARYSDFKSYIQDKQREFLEKEITAFVKESHDGRGFHSINVVSLCDQHVENIEVKSLNCRGTGISVIDIDVNITADIVMDGLGTKKYEADRKRKWFTVHEKAKITDKLEVLESRTEEYHPEKFDKLTALDEFLVPYVYATDLEEIADDFFEFYCKDANYIDGYAFPFTDVLREFELEAYEAELPENNMGRMYFRGDEATIYKWMPHVGEIKEENAKINPGTLLINKDTYFLKDSGSYILTICHEIFHWYYHQTFFKILSLLDDDTTRMNCDTIPAKYDENMTSLQKALWFVEWQANSVGMRIAMPQELFVTAMYEAKEAAEKIPRKGSYYGELMEDILTRVAKLFRVSNFAAKQRALQLGADAAAGTFIYIDGHYHAPFAFEEGTLGQRQSFVIDKASVEKLKKTNAKFAELLDSGKFIYLGYVVCINDSQYLKKLPEDEARWRGYEYDLSDYARDHVDECCLIFNWESISGANDDGGFYGQCYLSKDVSADNRIEHEYDEGFNYDTETLADQIARYKEAFKNEDDILSVLHTKVTFIDTLLYHMDRKHITLQDLGNRSGLSKTTISNYRNGKRKPDLDNLMALFVGLNLPEKYCDHMMGTLHMSLEDRDLKEKVYRILIREHSDGTIDQWNEILEGFGLDAIPDDRNQTKQKSKAK